MKSVNFLSRTRAECWTLPLFSCHLSSVWSFHTHLVHRQGSVLFKGMSSLTGSDICFPQELDYSTSCVHTGRLCSANLYTGGSRWTGVRVDAARRAARAVLCQRYEEPVGKENRQNAASDASYKLEHLNATLFFLALPPIFLHIAVIFLPYRRSSLLFLAGEWISSVFLGAKQVVLIFGDFISREECFRMTAWCSRPASGHAGRLCCVLIKNYPLMFSIKVFSEAERESKRKWKQGQQRRDEDG